MSNEIIKVLDGLSERLGIAIDWSSQNLIPCDIEGFCINEDGNLILMDECGNYAYCPPDRFQVNFDFNVYRED